MSAPPESNLHANGDPARPGLGPFGEQGQGIVIKMGRRIVIPRQPLLQALGLVDDKPAEELIAEMMERFWRGYLDRLWEDGRDLMHKARHLR